MTELAGALVGWQLGASAAAAFLLIRSWRRRAVLNQALHEVRRPLQALALGFRPEQPGPLGADSSLRLAAAALDRLEREINGGRAEAVREVVALRPILETAVERWRGHAALAGSELRLRHGGERVKLDADRLLLAQAIDNLIVNAIEHGGPSIAVEAAIRGGRARVAVVDSGREEQPARRRATIAGALAGLAGRRRRGHGLSVVREVAEVHGGRFSLQRAPGRTLAVLELPLAAGEGGFRG